MCVYFFCTIQQQIMLTVHCFLVFNDLDGQLSTGAGRGETVRSLLISANQLFNKWNREKVLHQKVSSEEFALVYCVTFSF